MKTQTKKLFLILSLSVMGFCCATLKAINSHSDIKQ